MSSLGATGCCEVGAAIAAGRGGGDVRMDQGEEVEAPCGILPGKAHGDPAEAGAQRQPSAAECQDRRVAEHSAAVGREGQEAATGVRPEKRGAQEMIRDLGSSETAPASTSLDATELLVAEILGGWQTCPGQANACKRVRSSSSSPLSHASTDVPEERQGGSLSSLVSSSSSNSSTKPSSRASLPSPNRGAQKRAPPSAYAGAAGNGAAAAAAGADRHEVPDWAVRIVDHLKTKGQNLLHAICSHYRIDLESIAEYSVEQIAHNAIFNPALPKAGRLPIMLKDVEGVKGWDMTFVRGPKGIYRSVRVSATIGKVPLTAECRACSYCGSVFSGRFMKNAMHQRAGGWKEITEKTAAGKYSWKSQLGKRLCVPCFTHFASQGTNLNANRLSLDQLIDAHSSEQSSWVHRRLGGESDEEASESSKGSGLSATTGSSLSESSGSDDGGEAAGLCGGEGEEDGLPHASSSTDARSRSSPTASSASSASSSSSASKPQPSNGGGNGANARGGDRERRGGERGAGTAQARAKGPKRRGPVRGDMSG